MRIRLWGALQVVVPSSSSNLMKPFLVYPVTDPVVTDCLLFGFTTRILSLISNRGLIGRFDGWRFDDWGLADLVDLSLLLRRGLVRISLGLLLGCCSSCSFRVARLVLAACRSRVRWSSFSSNDDMISVRFLSSAWRSLLIRLFISSLEIARRYTLLCCSLSVCNYFKSQCWI